MPLPTTIERRFAKVEVRADGEGKTLFGRAVEYGQTSDLLYGHFTEEIAPGTFDESLQSGRDIYCSVDHDINKILGRLSANTLNLHPDERGIGVECPVPPYSYAGDLVVAIQRGDLRGMSFIFDVKDDQWEKRNGTPHRTVTKADLYEVSFVFFPAYPETSAGLRSVPCALPVEGENRAVNAAKLVLLKDHFDSYRRRLRIAEALSV